VKESALQKQIMQYLNALPGCKAVKYPAGYYSRSGTPDILCCVEGQFIAIEVKTNTGLTLIQEKELCSWEASGAKVLVARSIEDVKDLLGGKKCAMD